MALAELLVQERVDERHVVVDPPHLEDLLPAQAELAVPALLRLEVVAVVVLLAELPLVPAVLDVAEQLDAELVRVEAARAHGQRARVVVGVVDDLGVGEGVLGHDRGVPVAGPALVHDLGHALRGEVVRLVADDGQDVALPVLERRVLQEEQQHVALRLVRERRFLRLARSAMRAFCSSRNAGGLMNGSM